MNIVITGASSGIGKAMVEIFARNGHNVLVVARREARLLSLQQGVTQRYGTSVYPLTLDITTKEAPQSLFEEASRVFGKVHVLINNAGMSPYQRFQEMSLAHVRRTIILNALSLTELCTLFIPHMLDHGEPSHVVNVGSVGGYAPLPYFSVYSGTKHYVRVFTDYLHHEYCDSNVKVSALHPGGTITEFAELAGQEIKDSARAAMMTPEQVAEHAYPAIMKGKRVIIPGMLNKLAALIGKVLPFPWTIRLFTLIYDQNIDKTDTTYSP